MTTQITPTQTPAAVQEMQQLKTRIAQVWAQREHLKRALADSSMPSRQGLRELETLDRELSELDTRFKQLWDA